MDKTIGFAPIPGLAGGSCRGVVGNDPGAHLLVATLVDFSFEYAQQGARHFYPAIAGVVSGH